MARSHGTDTPLLILFYNHHFASVIVHYHCSTSRFVVSSHFSIFAIFPSDPRILVLFSFSHSASSSPPPHLLLYHPVSRFKHHVVTIISLSLLLLPYNKKSHGWCNSASSYTSKLAIRHTYMTNCKADTECDCMSFVSAVPYCMEYDSESVSDFRIRTAIQSNLFCLITTIRILTRT